MPVTFCSNTITQSIISCTCIINSNKINDVAKEKRLEKVRLYNKRKRLEETPLERETRLEKMKAYRKK